MEFEYDPIKSELNRQKHGISLEETKELWETGGFDIPGRSGDEPRFLRIGIINGKFYSCIYTVRENAIRLISARRSRPDEERAYYKGRAQNEEGEKENHSG